MDPYEHHKYFSFCLQKGIRIYPVPQTTTGNVLKIAIEKNGRETIGQEKYNNINVYDKIKELLKTIYLKHHKK